MEGSSRLPPTSPTSVAAARNKEKSDDPPSTSHRPSSSLPHIPLPPSKVSSPPPHFRQHSLNLLPELSSSPPSPHPPDPIPETYVVQVPRDQVYWTPPPEHAKIVERRVNNNGPRKKNVRCCSKRCMWFFISVVILGFIICAVALVVRIVYKPKSPVFHVKKLTKTRGYEVMLSTKNPTSNMWVTYYKGLVSLTYKNKNIGEGNFPNLSLPVLGFHTVDLKLEGSKNAAALPPEMVSLVLKMNLNAKYGTGLMKRRKEVAVTCDVKVKGLDEKVVEIVSEICESKFTN